MSLLPLLNVVAASDGIVTSQSVGEAVGTIFDCPTFAGDPGVGHDWLKQSMFPVITDAANFASILGPVGTVNYTLSIPAIQNFNGSVYNRGFVINNWGGPNAPLSTAQYQNIDVPVFYGQPGTYNLGSFAGASGIDYAQQINQFTNQAQGQTPYLWPGSDGAYCVCSWDDDGGGSIFWFIVYEIFGNIHRPGYPVFHLDMQIPFGFVERVLPDIASFGYDGQQYFLSNNHAGNCFYTRMSVVTGPTAVAHTGQLACNDPDFVAIYGANAGGGSNGNGPYFTPFPGGYFFSSPAGNRGTYHIAFAFSNDFTKYMKFIIKAGSANSLSDMAGNHFTARLDPNGIVYGNGWLGTGLTYTSIRQFATFNVPPLDIHLNPQLPLPCFGQCDGPIVRL